MGRLYIEPTMQLIGNNGQTIYLYLVEGQDTIMSDETYQWYLDYVSDSSTLPQQYHPDNVMLFETDN